MPNSTVFRIVLTFLILLPAVISQSCCAFTQMTREIAREASRKQNAQKQDTYASRSSKNFKPVKGEVIENDRPYASVLRENLADLQGENFDAIDRRADQARREKERLAGGYWKLNIIYDSLTKIFTDGFVTEEMWTTHVARLNKWKQKSPGSITARVALAQSYIEYAWFARGSGYAKTMTDEDAQLTSERLELAYRELVEARKLSDGSGGCPQWYDSMLFLAMAQSWSAEEYDQLFEEAVAYEPDYYYYYYQKGTNSLPRWGGRKGDWEKLAREIETLDSKEKDVIYFLYVSQMLGSYHDEWTDQQGISWERAKHGYKQLEATFGTDKRRLNQYAFLASVKVDMPEAHAAFMKIDDDWDKVVWSKEKFHTFKNWVVAEGTKGKTAGSLKN